MCSCVCVDLRYDSSLNNSLIIKNDATCDWVFGSIASIRKVFTMEVHEQDRYLPIANISRIMKRSIPPTAKISKDAKECVQECVSEFIAFITSELELSLVK